MLPTPRSSGEEKAETVIKRKGRLAAKMHNLTAALAMLPTPTAQDGDNCTLPPSQFARDSIPGWMLRQVGTQTGGRLNPAFVEYLMGYPQGWTAVDDSASSSSVMP
jgi:hypothetical protein